ncbi:MAG: histidine phosphatase family protein, partial [Solirubrobacterales bacterium]
ELGREQTRAAAPHLAGIGARRILTSPLRRARETAEALAEVLELPVVEVEDLRELRESEGFGELSLEDQRLRRWSMWMTEHGDDPDHSYRGGETFNQVLGRVRSLQRRLLAEGDENVLAVSHGIFLRFLLMWSLLGEGFGPHLAERLWQLGTTNCGLSVFEHADPDPSDAWRCLTWMERLPPR